MTSDYFSSAEDLSAQQHLNEQARSQLEDSPYVRQQLNAI